MTMMYGMGMGARFGKAVNDRAKKRKLKMGMMKTVGQDPELRVDMDAQRKSGRRRKK